MKTALTPLALLVIIFAPAVAAYKDGPVPNSTGGFGEPSCQQCHLDNPLNAAGGTFSLNGVPERYEAQKTYQITVSLLREDLQRGGFELAARFASGRDRGRQAGGWRIVDERTRMIAGESDPTVWFVQHTARGSLTATRGAMAWTLEWTAPPGTGGPVEFSAAGNASNDDASPLGDYIYVTSARSAP